MQDLVSDILLKYFTGAQCELSISQDFTDNSPLLVNNHYSDLLRPSQKTPQVLTFHHNQHQEISCSSGFLSINNEQTKLPAASIQCTKSSKFKIGKENVEFHNISCSKEIEPQTRESDAKCPNGIKVEIGFYLTNQVFGKTLDVCYLPTLSTTTWAHAVIPAAVDGKQVNGPTPSFKKGLYFKNVKISKVYSVSNQHKTFLSIFDNDEKLANQYLPEKGKI